MASPISRLCEVIQNSALARWAPAPSHHSSSDSSAPQLLCGLHELCSGGGGGISGSHDALHSAQLLLQVPEAALKGTQHARLLQLLRPLLQAPCAGRQILHHAVPVPKARVAGMAGGKDSREATCTLVAAHARHAGAAAAVARGTMTLRCIYPTRVTVTGCVGKGQTTGSGCQWSILGSTPPIYSGPSSPLTSALQPRVSPVELLALRTGPSTETSTAVALACELEWEQAEVNQVQSRDRRQTAGLTHPGVHRKCPTSSHAGPLARLGWQAQGWQPRPLVRFQKLGAQRSQLRPWTLGRHGHCPLLGSQLQRSVDGHCRGSVPSRLQVQPVPAEMGTPVKGCTPVKGSPTQWSPPIPTLTVTALSGSLPMEARLAVGTARPLRVV